MTLADGLEASLKGYLGWSKPRRSYFIGMVLGLLKLKRINLTQVALGFGGTAQLASRYRRLRRFFSMVRLDGEPDYGVI